MREKCYQCFRPLKTCYCQWITAIDTGIKFVFLMHPREAYKQKTGTGRLAKLSLKDAELVIDICFNDQKIVNSLIKDPRYFPVLLYPGTNTIQADDPLFKVQLKTKKLLVFIIDATWAQSRQIMRLSTNLHTLPKISFQAEYRSQFYIKQQPRSYCLSTIESTYHLINELQDANLIDASVNPAGLIKVFQKMVDYQHLCNLNNASKKSADALSKSE